MLKQLFRKLPKLNSPEVVTLYYIIIIIYYFILSY